MLVVSIVVIFQDNEAKFKKNFIKKHTISKINMQKMTARGSNSNSLNFLLMIMHN